MIKKENRKIYEEELPHRGKFIDWEKIKNDNIKINFIYNEIKGYINIIKIEVVDKRSYATIQYKNSFDTLDIQNLKKCKLSKILKMDTSEFKIENELNVKLAKERIYEINYNARGEKMTIIKYNNYHDIVVMFDNKNITNTTYNKFKKGEVKNTFEPIICNIGYIGNGNYSSTDNNHKKTKEYQTWVGIIKRCYDEKQQMKQPTYKDCIICEEWYNFQNFAKWYEENYYEVEGQRMEIDKDILVKGNKIYSPENCIFVPHNINILFVKRNANRGNTPIGVSEYKNKTSIVFKATCRNTLFNKSIHLGYYSTPKQAFEIYKQYKENHIKEVADHYKNQIPNKLYQAMYNWKVEIDD